jgi:hypothetical protein
LIAEEVVKCKPRASRLRVLYRLLRAFERGDIQAASDLKTKALETANRLKQESLDLKRLEYQRRFALGPVGVRRMQEKIEKLEAENLTLKAQVAELEAMERRTA